MSSTANLDIVAGPDSGPVDPATLKARTQDAATWAERPETLTILLDDAVQRFGARPAIDFLGRSWRYRELGALVETVAVGLRALGLKRGDRVGLCLPNTPYSVIFFFGILKAGGTVVNFNPLYTGRECLNQIKDSGTTIVVVTDVERVYRPMASIAGEAGLAHLIVCSIADALTPLRAGFYRLFKARERAAIPKDRLHVTFGQLLATSRASRLAAASEPANPTDIAVLQYTGGTTGLSKGAALSHANLTANAAQVIRHAGKGAFNEGQERILGVLPFFHVFAMTTAMILAVRMGSQMILVPQFKLDDLLKTIVRCRPTVFPAVPTLYGAINTALASRKADLTSIRLCISGGAPLPREVRLRFEALSGCQLSEGYGLTECSPVVSANPLDGRPPRDGSAGLPMPGTMIEIRDVADPNRILPQGEKGEVCVRGPQVMTGYWRRPEETAAIMIEGALRTGDVGYLDQDGYLFLVERLKDLIICSGYNVYPRVIEEALHEHEDVVEAVAIGIPDAYRGEAPKAFVVLRPNSKATPALLRAFLAERLSKIELPKDVEIRSNLPKTIIGKLSKKELIAEERQRAAAMVSDAPEAQS